MLDTFFSQIKVRSRMESGPIGPYLSEIAAVLHRNGYARSTIRRHLRAADKFGAWILKDGMSVIDISTSTWIDTWRDWIVNFFRLAQEEHCPITPGAYGR